jgi:hypothetical protein
VRTQLIGEKNIKRQFEIIKSSLEGDYSELQQKFTKSIMLVSEEIDNLKDPFRDFIQDIEKQRTALVMELERTQYTNRQLIQQQCGRPNVFQGINNKFDSQGHLSTFNKCSKLSPNNKLGLANLGHLNTDGIHNMPHSVANAEALVKREDWERKYPQRKYTSTSPVGGMGLRRKSSNGSDVAAPLPSHGRFCEKCHGERVPEYGGAHTKRKASSPTAAAANLIEKQGTEVSNPPDA